MSIKLALATFATLMGGTLLMPSLAFAGSTAGSAMADDAPAPLPTPAESVTYVPDTNPSVYTGAGVDPYFHVGSTVMSCGSCGESVTAGVAILMRADVDPSALQGAVEDAGAALRSCYDCVTGIANQAPLPPLFPSSGDGSDDGVTPTVPFPDPDATDDYHYQVDPEFAPSQDDATGDSDDSADDTNYDDE